MMAPPRGGRGGPSPFVRAAGPTKGRSPSRGPSPIPTKEPKGGGAARPQRADGAISKLPRIGQRGGGPDPAAARRPHHRHQNEGFDGAPPSGIEEEEEEDAVEVQLRRAQGFVLPPNQKLLQDMIAKMLQICGDFRQIRQIVNPAWSARIESRLGKLEEDMRENEESDKAQQERMLALEKMLESEHDQDEEQEEKLRMLEQRLAEQKNETEARLREGEERDREAEERADAKFAENEERDREAEERANAKFAEGEERDRLAEGRANSKFAEGEERDRLAQQELTSTLQQQRSAAAGAGLLGALRGAKAGAGPPGVPLPAVPEGAAASSQPGKPSGLGALSAAAGAMTSKRQTKQDNHARFMGKVAGRAQANQDAQRSTKAKLDALERGYEEQRASVQRLLEEHERCVEPLKFLVQPSPEGGGTLVQQLVTENAQLKQLLAMSQRGQIELAEHVRDLQTWQAEAKEQLAGQRQEVYGSLEIAAEEHDALRSDFAKLSVTVSQIVGKLAYLIHT